MWHGWESLQVLTTVQSSLEQPKVPMSLPLQLLPSLCVADAVVARAAATMEKAVAKCMFAVEVLGGVCAE